MSKEEQIQKIGSLPIFRIMPCGCCAAVHLGGMALIALALLKEADFPANAFREVLKKIKAETDKSFQEIQSAIDAIELGRPVPHISTDPIDCSIDSCAVQGH